MSGVAIQGAGLFETSSSFEEVNERNRLLGWNIDYRQLRPLEYQGVLLGMESKDSTILIEDIDVPSELVGEFQADEVAVVLAHNPAGRGVFAQKMDFCCSSAFLLNGGGEVEVVTGETTKLAQLYLPAEEFHRAWEALAPGADPFQSRYYGFINIPQSYAQICYSEILRILPGGYANTERKEEFISSVLAILALQATAAQPGDSRREQIALRARLLARARDYIEARLVESIRLSDLCRYTGTSISTLSRIFREYYAMSPSAYIRWRRMYDCHYRLREAEPGEMSTGQIIQACGIRHPGRFASEYRRYFGETPKQTLGYLR